MDRFQLELIAEKVQECRGRWTQTFERLPDGTLWSNLEGVDGILLIAKEECNIKLTKEQAEEVCDIMGWRKY